MQDEEKDNIIHQSLCLCEVDEQDIEAAANNFNSGLNYWNLDHGPGSDHISLDR